MIEKQEKMKQILKYNLKAAKKKHGSILVRYLKIFCTGSGAAGKTSFINLLLKNKFIEEHHSTNVVHTNHAVSVRTAAFRESTPQSSDVNWIEMDLDFEVRILRSVLCPPELPLMTSTSNITAINKSDVLSKPTSSLTLDVPIIRHTYKSPSSALRKVSSKFFESSVKETKVTSFNRILGFDVLGLAESSHKEAKVTSYNRILDSSGSSPSSVTCQPGKVLNMITILDTGGQPEYIHLLPTINIYPTVTFIVHDLSKSLDDPVLVEYSQHGEHMFVPYHLNYSNMDMIKLLMSAANDAIRRSPSNIPYLVSTPTSNNSSYICFVGTHADKIPKEVVAKTGERLTTVVNNTKSKAAVWYKEDGDVLFAIDNTTAGKDTEDPAANVLRSRIEEVAAERDVYELPIMWMLLQLEIQQVCSKKQKSYITVKECVKLAKSTGLISNQDEVKSVLLYYHLLRVLIYFEDVPGLCDYVIVDHQWWFDILSNIISSAFQQSKLKFKAVQKLKYEGILSKELLQCIKWEEEIKEEFFLSLLVHMKIIATVVTGNGREKQYFIPFV